MKSHVFGMQDMIDTKLRERLAVFQEQIHTLISQAVSPASGSASGGFHRCTTETLTVPGLSCAILKEEAQEEKEEVLFLQD